MKNKWIVFAMVLGLSFLVPILIIKPVGVSTQFNVVVGMVESTLNKNLIKEEERDGKKIYSSTNEYYNKSNGKIAKSIKNPLNYSLVFVLAIPLGAGLGYILLGKKKIDSEKKRVKNQGATEKGVLAVFLPSFVGGFLVLFGARLAGGCTSGHMMSGIMQSSVSGFFFAAAVFIVAIPIAVFRARRK